VDPKGNVRLKDTLQLLSTRTEPTMSDVLTAYQIIIAEAIAKKVGGVLLTMYGPTPKLHSIRLLGSLQNML
jgi:hypothetical protein